HLSVRDHQEVGSTRFQQLPEGVRGSATGLLDPARNLSRRLCFLSWMTHHTNPWTRSGRRPDGQNLNLSMAEANLQPKKPTWRDVLPHKESPRSPRRSNSAVAFSAEPEFPRPIGSGIVSRAVDDVVSETSPRPTPRGERLRTRPCARAAAECWPAAPG